MVLREVGLFRLLKSYSLPAHTTPPPQNRQYKCVDPQALELLNKVGQFKRLGDLAGRSTVEFTRHPLRHSFSQNCPRPSPVKEPAYFVLRRYLPSCEGQFHSAASLLGGAQVTQLYLCQQRRQDTTRPHTTSSLRPALLLLQRRTAFSVDAGLTSGSSSAAPPSLGRRCRSAPHDPLLRRRSASSRDVTTAAGPHLL